MQQHQCAMSWKAHKGEVYSVDFSYDENAVYSIGEDGKVSDPMTGVSCIVQDNTEFVTVLPLRLFYIFPLLSSSSSGTYTRAARKCQNTRCPLMPPAPSCCRVTVVTSKSSFPGAGSLLLTLKAITCLPARAMEALFIRWCPCYCIVSFVTSSCYICHDCL